MTSPERITRQERLSDWSRLAASSQAGNRADYQCLLRDMTPVLLAYFRNNFRQAGAAEDLTQETLLAVHTKFHTYDPQQPFAPWLFAIARYKGIDNLRRTARQITTAPLPDDGNIAAPANEADTREAELSLQAALQSLSPRDRQLIELGKLQGLSLNELAGHTGLGLSAAKVGLYRAMKRLRGLLLAEKENS